MQWLEEAPSFSARLSICVIRVGEKKTLTLALNIALMPSSDVAIFSTYLSVRQQRSIVPRSTTGGVQSAEICRWMLR